MYPTKSESAEIERVCVEAGVQRSAVLDVFDHLQRDAFKLDDDGLQKFLAEQKTYRPHWFEPAILDAEASVARAATDLEIAAFETPTPRADGTVGPGSATARGELVRSIGAAAADARATAWSLTGIADFKSKPTRPVIDEPGKTRKPDDERAKNPFSSHWSNIDPKTKMFNARALARQSELARVDVKMAAGLAASVGVTLGSVRPRADAA